jgi:hypothetical protein
MSKLMFTDRHRALIRFLIYPVQFDRNPIDGVERVLTQIANSDYAPAEYALAIDAALLSDESLSSLIPQRHPEPMVRAYLAELQMRLRS